MIFVLILVAAAVFNGWSLFEKQRHSPHGNNQNIGGDFTLLNSTTKQPFTLSSAKTPLKLVYFGYTYCPDVCPTGLTRITQALALLTPAQRSQVTTIFITVDPERDTPETLASYISNFDTSILALTGSMQQITATAEQFGVYFKAQKQTPTDKDYAVDHSSYIYLLDANNHYLAHVSHTTDATILAQKLQQLLVP